MSALAADLPVNTFDVSMALQIATFFVAAIGPLLAYRYARRLAVSANRQAWLDALRQDLASLIALADAVAVLWLQRRETEDGPAKATFENLLRDKMTELQTLRYRIRLRLRRSNPEHAILMDAIDRLSDGHKLSLDERRPLREELVTKAEGVVIQVWRRIEKGG